jgi:hypothetical protein
VSDVTAQRLLAATLQILGDTGRTWNCLQVIGSKEANIKGRCMRGYMRDVTAIIVTLGLSGG